MCLRDHVGLCLSGTHRSDTHPARHTPMSDAYLSQVQEQYVLPQSVGVGTTLHSTPCFSLPLDGGRAADLMGLLPQEAWGRDV